MEIERKFLIDRFPDLPELMSAKVWQGYLSTAPVVRIRRAELSDGSERFEMTVKGKGTLVRAEVNIDITAEQYYEMEPLLTRELIFKDYHVYDLGNGLRLECSIVDGDTDHGFSYAEVEFDSVEAAHAFVPPACLGREVTEVPGFSMNSYWRNGRIVLD
ncbi:MAG: adenylate cyclase [Clostridia bacterium]|nr:adenylate cyclase [Clostridia bacterium]